MKWSGIDNPKYKDGRRTTQKYCADCSNTNRNYWQDFYTNKILQKVSI